VIPPLEQIVEAFPFVARRWRVEPLMSVAAVRAALDHASSLGVEGRDEPAALFFAFATYRRAFPRAWRRMAALLAMNQARSLGLAIDASAADLDGVASRIMLAGESFEAVRAWFAARLRG
jgi:hypothetical protein